MAQTSIPWTGTSPGDAGPYSSDQWAQIWRELVGAGFGAGGSPNSGIIWGSGSTTDPGLTVIQNSPTGQSIILTPGVAIVNGTVYRNDANLVIATAANGSGNPRIDTVVLRKDWAAQTVRAVVKQGTPAVTPVPSGMTQSQGVTWEIPIADLTLANSYTTIATAQIAGRFNYKNVAPMDVIENMVNASGITALPGDVAVWGTTAGQFTTSALRGAQVAGVVMDRISAGGSGRLLRRGLYPVRLSAAAATMNSIVVHEANFVAVIPSSLSSLWNAFAVTREITAGAGLCLCYVDVTTPKPKAIISNIYNPPSDITSTSGSYVDVDANLAVTVITSTGNVRTRFIVPVEFSHTTGTAWMCMNIKRDGTTFAVNDARGLRTGNPVNNFGVAGAYVETWIVEYLWKGLTPGSHTFNLQWLALLGTGGSPIMTLRSGTGNGGMISRIEAEELDQTV